MRIAIEISARILRPFFRTLNLSKDLGDLLARIWVAQVFFTSALSKVTDWNTTLVLFKYVYSTPFISPVVAAYLGTTAEFILPVILVLGLGGRLFVLLFFIYNIICVLSYHFLWTPVGSAGLDDHILWGLLLMMLMLHGMGRVSLDYFIHRKFGFLIHPSLGKNGPWINFKEKGRA